MIIKASKKYIEQKEKYKRKRKQSIKRRFLKSIGLKKLPKGYHVDHIIPLHKGGKDEINNLQLLSIAKHKEKTKYEAYIRHRTKVKK